MVTAVAHHRKETAEMTFNSMWKEAQVDPCQEQSAWSEFQPHQPTDPSNRSMATSRSTLKDPCTSTKTSKTSGGRLPAATTTFWQPQLPRLQRTKDASETHLAPSSNILRFVSETCFTFHSRFWTKVLVFWTTKSSLTSCQSLGSYLSKLCAPFTEKKIIYVTSKHSKLDFRLFAAFLCVVAAPIKAI